MNNIISRIFAKRGIKNSSELTEEERVEFDNWQRILSRDELTIKDIKEFSERQIGALELIMHDISTPRERLERLVTLHSVYKALIAVIESPQKEREALEKQLTAMLE